jgi:hypothetical protein
VHKTVSQLSDPAELGSNIAMDGYRTGSRKAIGRHVGGSLLAAVPPVVLSLSATD